MITGNIFSAILNMSLTASLVILIVCLARFAMKKAPKIYSYVLWLLVLFRLLCPFSLFTSVSVIPEEISSGKVVSDWESDYIEEVQVHYEDTAKYEAAVHAGRVPIFSVAPSKEDSAENHTDSVNQETAVGADEAPTPSTEPRSYVLTGNDGISEPKTVENTVMPLLSFIWLAGVAAMLLPGVLSYIRIKRKTKVVIPLKKNIYIGDDVASPFVIGFLRPVIYLPGTLDESEREYIIAHESHHIRRGDHIFKALGFLALTLHWFNPLAWLAFMLAVRDMEMSCDEAVIRKLGEGVRADYAASLLKLATGKQLFAGSPLSFGENDPKGRVRNLSKWKKPAIWVIILCVVVCAVLAVVLLTNMDGKEPEQNKTTPDTTTAPTEETIPDTTTAPTEETIPDTTTAPTEETIPDTTGQPIERLPEKHLFTMEDFSSLVKQKSTYEDLCKLMPESQQPEMHLYHGTESGYCDYSAIGGFIRISFGEDLIMRNIRFYAREGSELYPIKDASVFSFIVPGETTLMEVVDAVPHPTYCVPATGGMLSWLTYEVVDGSEVRIYFWQNKEQRGIVHSVEVIKNENAQTVKGYPLVFADIGEERTNYFVLGFVSDGKLITTDQFLYSGKKLDYYLENPSEVTSDILPVGTRLAFVNEKWESFRANTTGLYCEGEMMYQDIWVYGKVDVIHLVKGYYLGAPSGVKLYPDSVACRDDGFTMDLNADNRTDSVSWTFTESEEGDDLFDYEIKVKVGDREQVIVNEDGYPCGKEDLSVWPIDLEQDGVYELVIYNKLYSLFGDLRIYRFNGTYYEKQFSYIFENMP